LEARTYYNNALRELLQSDGEILLAYELGWWIIRDPLDGHTMAQGSTFPNLLMDYNSALGRN
jgi:hypothetical protein